MRSALMAVLVACAAGTAAAQTCPQVYRIQGTADPTKAYNILFLSSGFTEEQLPGYRKAALEYAQGLLKIEPYDQFDKLINVLRIDLAGKPVESLCPESLNCPATALPALPESFSMDPGEPLFPDEGRPEHAEIDLGVKRCWRPSTRETPHCRVLWLGTDGQVEALDLAYCAPNVSLVVVIANVTAVAGGGREESHTDGIGLAVAGVPLAGTPSPGEVFDLNADGEYLVVHELSHGLGMLDEYITVAGRPNTPYRHGRNVWRPALAEGEDWDPTSGEPACPPIPWESALECGDGIAPCCSTDGPASGTCPFVRPPSEGCSCADGPRNPPGVWEGAFYQMKGYYRSRLNCTMSSLDPEIPFCEACRLQIRRVLCHFDRDLSDCPPPVPEPTEACRQRLATGG